MSAYDHLNPRLFDPGPRLTAEEQDQRTHQKMGQELAQFGEVQVSLPERAALGIAQTGDIRTQFETQGSEGAYSPSLRADVEIGAMGYAGHPVYGAVSRGPGEPRHYGRAVFHLDSSVKDRSTLFPGDSLNMAQLTNFGAEFSQDDVVSSAPQAKMRDVASGATPALVPRDWDSSYEDIGYAEAHIHPGPSFTGQRGPAYQSDRGLHPTSRVPKDQIRRVTLHEDSGRFATEESRDARRPDNFAAGQALSDAGMKVDHSLVDFVEQPSLPMQYHDGPQPPSKYGKRRRLVRHEDMRDRDRWGSA